MEKKIEVGDLVRFAHIQEPAGRVTMARDDRMFAGGRCVEIEGWAGEFAVSGLIVVEEVRRTKSESR